MKRREFLASCAAGLLLPEWARPEPVAIHYRRPPPFQPYVALKQAGMDEFIEEKAAMDLLAALRAWNPKARFYVLPGGLVRRELKLKGTYVTGTYRPRVQNGKILSLEAINEYTASQPRTWFCDVTGAAFENVPAFAAQLSRGIPYWTARLDPATGIDIYGNQGIAVGDVDGDGIDEIYVCQPGGLPNRLFKNVRGKFADLSANSGVDLLDDTCSALFLDLRNSGKQDLVVLTSRGPHLFLNRGDGTFELKPDAFEFANSPQGSFTGMAAADYDRDGKVDLYLCSYLFFHTEAQYRYPTPYHDAQNGPPNFLFRNQLDEKGGGKFVDVTAASGLDQDNNRYSFAAAWCDYDGDGWPDLFVANDFGRKNLYKNEGGKFHDVAATAGVEDLGPGMSAAWFDYDGDGRPDLYVSNMWSDAGQRVTNSAAFPLSRTPALKEAYRRHAKGNSLYRNLGNGSFADVSARQGIEMGRWAWSADGHDFDCDGRPEIFIACGMMTNAKEPDLMSFFWRQVVAKSPTAAQSPAPYEAGWNALNQFIREGSSWNGHEPNVFLVPRDDCYRDFSGVSGLDVAEDGRAFAVTDLTGDGTLDILLKSRLGPQVRVFRNQSTGAKNKMAFRLRGTKSNRDAIGSRIEVDGQVKWVAAGSGYLSQHTKTVHFGLADRVEAKHVRILWPSGQEQTLGPLQEGFLYEVVEGNPATRRIPLAARFTFPEHIPTPESDNRPRLESTWFITPVPLPDERKGPGLVTIDRNESPDTLAAYSLFRRYLFEYRADLELPLHLLVDARGRARKVYSERPSEQEIQRDLHAGAQPLPFPGRYLNPPYRDMFKIGAALLWAEYPEQALPYLKAALEQAPNNAAVMVLVAQVHLDAKRTFEARSILQEALKGAPGNASAWNDLGGVEMADGKPREAIRLYEKALDLDPEFVPALLNSAQAHASVGEQSAAERLFQRALELDPQRAEAANGLGLALANQNRVPDARRAFERAIELRPDFGSAINNLGVLYGTAGDLPNAIAAWLYGVTAAPDDDDIRMNLARGYLAVGKKDKARQVLKDWLERKPANRQAQQALVALEDH